MSSINMVCMDPNGSVSSTYGVLGPESASSRYGGLGPEVHLLKR